jgi:hypothetical protein
LKYTEIRLVNKDEHLQIRFEGERIEGDETFETGGVLFDVYHVDTYYVLCKISNSEPFKVCNTIEELIVYLRDKTGLMLKQDLE